MEDLGPLLSGTLFPRLTFLGLCDSHLADPIAAALAASPLLRRLQTLDLSLGTLSDEGAQALLSSTHLAGLRRLDAHHHYCSGAMMARLKALPLDVDVSEPEDEKNYDGRYVAVGE